MFYTVGKTNLYTNYFLSQGNPRKLGRCLLNGKPYEGGSIWKTYKDAKNYLEMSNQKEFSVYGVLAQEEDIEFKNNDTFGCLLKTSLLVSLSLN